MKKQRIFVRVKNRDLPTISKKVSTNAETLKNPFNPCKKILSCNLGNCEFSTSGLWNDRT